MGCNVKLLFWRQICCHRSQPNLVLHVTSHVYAYLSGGFWKRRNIMPPFRKTRRHIAALTLEQMCRLFYLKRAYDSCSQRSHIFHSHISWLFHRMQGNQPYTSQPDEESSASVCCSQLSQAWSLLSSFLFCSAITKTQRLCLMIWPQVFQCSLKTH